MVRVVSRLEWLVKCVCGQRGRDSSTNESTTYAGRRRFSGRGACHTGRRAPSPVGTITVLAGRVSRTSDATVPRGRSPGSNCVWFR